MAARLAKYANFHPTEYVWVYFVTLDVSMLGKKQISELALSKSSLLGEMLSRRNHGAWHWGHTLEGALWYLKDGVMTVGRCLCIKRKQSETVLNMSAPLPVTSERNVHWPGTTTSLVTPPKQHCCSVMRFACELLGLHTWLVVCLPSGVYFLQSVCFHFG